MDISEIVVKQKNSMAEGRNRRALQDIGNLVKPRAEEGKVNDQKKITKKVKETVVKPKDDEKALERSRAASGKKVVPGKKNLKTFTSTLSARSKVNIQSPTCVSVVILGVYVLV